MITPPLELNDTVVSDVDGFITISSKSFESFLDKSRIDIFFLEPTPIGFAFTPFLFGHSFLVLNPLPLDLSNFVAYGLGVCVVFDRYKIWSSHGVYNKNVNNERFNFLSMVRAKFSNIKRENAANNSSLMLSNRFTPSVTIVRSIVNNIIPIIMRINVLHFERYIK